LPRTTRTVDRALRLLVTLSRRPQMGWRLTDLARECELDLATASRLLADFARYGAVARRRSDRHFVVGPELLNLGLAAGYHVELVREAEAIARELAAETRQVAFVYARSSGDFVCLARSGRPSMRALGIEVGTRRALLRSAGGVAILLALPAVERNALVAENRARIARDRDERAPGIERMLRRSQRLRYALNRDDVVPGITALAVGTALPAPWSAASVLVAGPSAEITAAGIARLAKRVARAAEQLRSACRAPG
jgi:DNA-binding IclR family transcriptional regulator